MKKNYETPEMEEHECIETDLLAETVGTGEENPDAKQRSTEDLSGVLW